MLFATTSMRIRSALSPEALTLSAPSMSSNAMATLSPSPAGPASSQLPAGNRAPHGADFTGQDLRVGVVQQGVLAQPSHFRIDVHVVAVVAGRAAGCLNH